MRHLRAGRRPRRLSRLHHIQFTASGAIRVGKWVMYFGMGGFFARDRDIVALSNIFRALVSCRSLRPRRDCRRAGPSSLCGWNFRLCPKPISAKKPQLLFSHIPFSRFRRPPTASVGYFFSGSPLATHPPRPTWDRPCGRGRWVRAWRVGGGMRGAWAVG